MLWRLRVLAACLLWMTGACFCAEEDDASGQAALALQESVLQESAGWVESLSTPDLNGDGLPDILIASYRGGTVSWLKNRGGSFGAPQVLLSDVPGISCAVAADFDGDGDLDVAASGLKSSTVWLFTNRGGSFSEAQIMADDVPTAGTLEPVDLDGDGDMDLALASWDADAVGWLKNDGGVFTLQSLIDDDANGVADLAAGDLNGDGIMDLVSACWNSGTFKFHQQASGEFANTVMQENVMGATAVELVDLDGDGLLDVLTAASNDDEIRWIPGSSLAFGTYDNRLIADDVNGVKAITTVDFDNDGDLDILAALYYDARFVWIENQGDSVLGSPITIADGHGGAALIAVADMNADGLPDLVTAEHQADTLTLFMSSGHALAVKTTAVCPQTVLEGEAAPLLAVNLQNYGSETTTALLMRTLAFRMHDIDGNALGSGALASIMTRYALCVDDGDGTFALGVDLPVAVLDAPDEDGTLTFTLPTDTSDTRIEANAEKTFFLVADIAEDALENGLLDGMAAVYVSHLTPSTMQNTAVLQEDGVTAALLCYEEPVIAGPLVIEENPGGVVTSIDAACTSGLAVAPGEALTVQASITGTGLADVYAAVIYQGATFVLSAPETFADAGTVVPLASRVRLDEGATLTIWDAVVPQTLPDGPLFWVVLAVPAGADVFTNESSVMDTAYCQVSR